MKIVLALGMSRPLSMIVVASSMSNLRPMKSTITRSSSPSGIWPWPMTQIRLGHDPLQPLSDQLDVVDAVVDEINLPAAVQLAHDGVADQLLVPAADARLDGQPIFGRRFEVRNVAHADQRHVQRARNRRGRHREHVDGRPQCLEPLLDFDAEPLLLVDDQQAQVVRSSHRAAQDGACR